MVDVAPSSTARLLQHLHEALVVHFAELHAARQSLEPSSPVFALEHGLSSDDLDLLSITARFAVKEGLGACHQLWWLPFVVYATESGYDYAGDEYWTSFDESTPGWHGDQRTWINAWFQRFATDYGGAVPAGTFASNFTIIARPITYAVLPTYLQRHFVQLLCEFRGALIADLLDDPVSGVDGHASVRAITETRAACTGGAHAVPSDWLPRPSCDLVLSEVSARPRSDGCSTGRWWKGVHCSG